MNDPLSSSRPIRFVTSVYGKKYGGMLLSLLYSIKQSNPDANVSIFWQDVSDATRSLEQVFPEYEFIDTAVDTTGDLIDRIAEKTQLWSQAVRRYPDESIALIDSDMLVVKDIASFFDVPFDIAFTHKKGEIYPINTGTMLVRSNDRARSFLDMWATRSSEINRDPLLRMQATTRSYGYGAPDQMAFSTLIGFSSDRDTYEVPVADGTVSVQGFSCEELNETNSCPVTGRTHIIHYKAGWHSILLNGTGFTTKRSKKDSWEMYILYLTTYKAGVDYVQSRLGTKASTDDFGIRIPFYLDGDLKEHPMLYRIFALKEYFLAPIRVAVMRIKRFMKRKSS